MKQTGKKSNSNGFFRFFWYRILSGERLFGLQRHNNLHLYGRRNVWFLYPYFYEKYADAIRQVLWITKSVGEFEIALIPKSSPEDKNVLEQVCREIVKKERFILGSAFDGSDLLVRTKGLSPVHYGGVHSVEEIAGSMKVSRPLKSKRIILLDDLVFSGHTDLACRKLLNESGAEEIFTICMYGHRRPL